MDAHFEKAGENKAATGGGSLCSVACIVLFGYFYGTYYFNNPDATQADGTMLYCWAGNQPLVADANNFVITDADGTGLTEAQKLDYVNVTQNFLTFFEWGFILQMLAAGAVVCSGLLFFSPKLAGSLIGLIMCAQCCGSLAWVITGMVLGWRQSGNICSMGVLAVPQDAIGATTPGVLYSSGTFINVMNIIHVSVMGCLCCMSLVGFFCGACASLMGR